MVPVSADTSVLSVCTCKVKIDYIKTNISRSITGYNTMLNIIFCMDIYRILSGFEWIGEIMINTTIVPPNCEGEGKVPGNWDPQIRPKKHNHLYFVGDEKICCKK